MMKKVLLYLNKVYNNEKLLISLIFLLSCIISVVFLVFFANIGPEGHMALGTDYLQCYAPIAENIISGKDIILNKEYVRCAPGYAFLLVPIFYLSDAFSLGRVPLILFFNVILTAISAAILFLIARNVFSKNVSLISSLLWLSYPLNQWLIKNPNSEVPFITLLLLGTLLYMKLVNNPEDKKYAFWSGLAMGIAALVRPIGLLVPLVLIMLVFFLINQPLKKKAITAFIILLGSIVFILPWELYALNKTGDLMPLSTGGPATIREGFYFGARSGAGGDKFKASEDVMNFMAKIYSEPVVNNKSYRELAGLLWRETLNSPTAFFKLMIIKIARSWYGTSQLWLEWRIALLQLPYLIFGTAGVFFAIKKHKEKSKQIMVLLAPIAYFWLMVVATLSIARYMIPVMAFVAIFSAVALYHIFLEKHFKKYAT